MRLSYETIELLASLGDNESWFVIKQSNRDTNFYCWGSYIYCAIP